MPTPTAEENTLAEIVEGAAMALANLAHSSIFQPGYDDADGQRVRDVYRRQARTVIDCSRAHIEASLIARYRQPSTALSQVLRVGAESPADEVERYQREARDAAADSGRRLKLLAQAYAALTEVRAKCLWHQNLPPVEGCGACESATIVGGALAALQEEAARSPWLAERISETQDAGRG